MDNTVHLGSEKVSKNQWRIIFQFYLHLNKSEFHTIELHCAKFSSNWLCVFFFSKENNIFYCFVILSSTWPCVCEINKHYSYHWSERYIYKHYSYHWWERYINKHYSYHWSERYINKHYSYHWWERYINKHYSYHWWERYFMPVVLKIGLVFLVKFSVGFRYYFLLKGSRPLV